MRQVKLIVFVIILNSFYSCGLKITEEVNENLLGTDWSLVDIYCYLPNSSDYVERYTIGTDPEVTLSFKSDTFQYTVDSTSCTTTAYGNYVTEFDGDLSDTVDLINVVSGSTCDLTLNFQGQSGSGSSTVEFTLLPTKSSNLTWTVNDDKDRLYIDLYTNFIGSNLGSYCGSSCSCEAVYDKK